MMFSILVPVRQHPANEEFLNPGDPIQSLLLTILLSATTPNTNKLSHHLSFSISYKRTKTGTASDFSHLLLLLRSQDQIGKWHVRPLKSSSAEEKVTKEVLVHFTESISD